MTLTYLHLASALCAGTGIGLITAAHYYGDKLLKYDKENAQLRDVITDQRAKISTLVNWHTPAPAPAPQETQMCGGCGAYLTQEEIAKCLGEVCPRYAENALPLFEGHPGIFFGEWPHERKIPIGYTGHLHTTKKPL